MQCGNRPRKIVLESTARSFGLRVSATQTATCECTETRGLPLSLMAWSSSAICATCRTHDPTRAESVGRRRANAPRAAYGNLTRFMQTDEMTLDGRVSGRFLPNCTPRNDDRTPPCESPPVCSAVPFRCPVSTATKKRLIWSPQNRRRACRRCKAIFPSHSWAAT